MIYIFHREEGFYPIDIPDHYFVKRGEAAVIEANARLNPGTLKVERSNGTTVWQMPEAQ